MFCPVLKIQWQRRPCLSSPFCWAGRMWGSCAWSMNRFPIPDPSVVATPLTLAIRPTRVMHGQPVDLFLPCDTECWLCLMHAAQCVLLRWTLCGDQTFHSRYLDLCMSCMVNLFPCLYLITLSVGRASSILHTEFLRYGRLDCKFLETKTLRKAPGDHSTVSQKEVQEEDHGPAPIHDYVRRRIPYVVQKWLVQSNYFR
jgi:hypothetical protein